MNGLTWSHFGIEKRFGTETLEMPPFKDQLLHQGVHNVTCQPMAKADKNSLFFCPAKTSSNVAVIDHPKLEIWFYKLSVCTIHI